MPTGGTERSRASLDAPATGVLAVGVERATRLLTYLVGADKEYLATIRLGAATVTDDAQGEVISRQDATAVTPDAVAAGVARLTGPIIMQTAAIMHFPATRGPQRSRT
jgi:tRNA pseudouridine55 synthase